MADESGQIAVDFLLGISLFLVALIFTVQFVPGLFMSGSAGESSLDYTAYRTAAILVEDTGWWMNSTTSGSDWEHHPNDILRLGLAIDDDSSTRLTKSPNLLSKKKIIQLMAINKSTLVTNIGLYNNVDDTLFTYGYNISITKNNASIVLNNTTIAMGEPLPDDKEISKITRVVLVETGVIAQFDAKELPIDPYSPGVENTILNITGPLNEKIVLRINNLNITGIDPSFKKLILNGTNLNEGPDYTSYKIVNGTMLPLTSTGKIDNNGIVIFYLEPDLFSGSQTYQLQIDMKDVTFTKTAPPYLEYTQRIETLYEPAYLTVEVWQ